MKWLVASFTFGMQHAYIPRRILVSVLYLFPFTGNCVHGRRFHVSIVWEVQRHGLGCEKSMSSQHGCMPYQTK